MLTGAQRLLRPVLVTGLALVLYLIAGSSGAGWLYVVAAATGAAVLVSAALPRWNVACVEVGRRAPGVATAGQDMECSMELRNGGRLARYLLEAEDRFAGGAGRGLAVRVAARGRDSVGYTVRDPRRGIYRGGEVLISSGAPFGLFYARRRLQAVSRTVVYPKTFDVADLPQWAPDDAERGEGSESSALRRDHGGEFWGVREYRPGDPARLIAWRRSARSISAGKLAVVELARETRPPLVVALDLDPAAPHEAREMVISLAASLLLRALLEGLEVEAFAGRQEFPFPKETSPDAVLAWCAGLRPALAPDPAGASVEVRPSTSTGAGGPRRGGAAREGVARAVVLVSCRDFAQGSPGAWMSEGEEREYIRQVEASGRIAALIRRGFEGPLRFR